MNRSTSMDAAEATERWQRFCAGGEGAAFDELYRAYRVRVVRYCRARLHDEEAAADIANQLFAYLYLKRPACTGNFESLLFHYARQCCLNFRPRPPTIPLADCPAPAMLMVDPADAAAKIEHRRRGWQVTAKSKGPCGAGAVARPLATRPPRRSRRLGRRRNR